MPVSEEELRREYAKLSSLQERLQTLLAQRRLVEAQLKEVESTAEALRELSKVKEKNESFVHVGSGVYLRVSVPEEKEFLVDVGAKTVVEKNVSGVLSYLEERSNKLKDVLELLKKNIEELSPHIRESEARLAKLVKELESGPSVAG